MCRTGALRKETRNKVKKRTYGTGTVAKGRREDTWELRYTPKGSKRLSKTVEAPNKKAAEDELTTWRKQLDRQANPGVTVPMSLLFEKHLKDMRRENRDPMAISIEEQRIKKHLEPRLGRLDANALKKSHITDYRDDRLEAGAARATINRELSALRRSLNIAIEEGLLTTPPPRIPAFKENNVRKGFVERETYSTILQALPRHAQTVWCFAYYLGIRKGELLSTAFELARERAGLPKLIFHDTRRTAVRLMEKAGIARAEAMQITGHKTESVYKRYDLASERGATETGRRMREFHSQLSQAGMELDAKTQLGDKLGDKNSDQALAQVQELKAKLLN
jgi:hypothetical protein